MNSLKLRCMEKCVWKAIKQVKSLSTAPTTVTATNSQEEIQVPKYIERGPTDVLQALESTVSRDPTAPHYKYIDDPFFIPLSLNRKRTYALSKESGKKAAQWIRDEHPELLFSKLSEPLVEAFLPVEKYDDKSKVSEEKLLLNINKGNVNNAVQIYNLLEGDISLTAKKALLQLLCFYNSTNDLPEDYIEERNFQFKEKPHRNMWKNNPVIEKLFAELKLDQNCVTFAYNTLISGTAKYLQAERAWGLYEECEMKNIPIFLTTYNYLIQLIPLMRDNSEERQTFIENFLKSIALKKIKPNVRTLNACLTTISSFNILKLAKESATSILKKFIEIGVSPSLASYYYLIKIHYQDGSMGSDLLNTVLNDLETRDYLEIQDTMDTAFFSEAMEIANKYIYDFNIGDRLHKLLIKDKNYRLIGDRMKEAAYYRNYLTLLISSVDYDAFMKVYDNLVPHVYIPEPSVLKETINMLELQDPGTILCYLPRFLSQMITFDLLGRHHIMLSVYKILTDICRPEKDSDFEKQSLEFTWTVWNTLKENSKKKIQKVLWPSNVLGDMAIVLLRGQEFEKMMEILEFLLKSQSSVIGNIRFERIHEILTVSLQNGNSETALLLLQYACEYGMSEAPAMAKKITNTLPLSPKEESKLQALVGEEIFGSKAPNKIRSKKKTFKI